MEFISILDLAESPHKEEERPAFFLDLNLNQIIDRICKEWGEDVKAFYYYLPADRACEDYRREVYADIKQEKLYDILCDFAEGMRAWQEASGKKEEVRRELQAIAWHIREVGCYCGSFMRLSRELEGIGLKSRGMRNFGKYLQQYLASENFREMQAQAEGLLGQLGEFRLTLTYENDRITVSQKEITGAYDSFLDGCFPGQDRRMKSPLDVSSNLSELEQEIFKVVQKQNPGFFQKAQEFYKKYREYAEDALVRFTAEISYYLSFYCFEKRMMEEGFGFAEPVMCGTKAQASPDKEESSSRPGLGHPAQASPVGEESSSWPEPGSSTRPGTGIEMSAQGLYDLALACAGRGEVVSNDMEYKAGENFFVLTGPNQGGKTTFARSLGQLVYFTKMGLDVPAHSAFMPYFTDILTHFSVEESVETGRGKLKEELIRLAPMMGVPVAAGTLRAARDSKAVDASGAVHAQKGAFVVINELFTTAANYDACIMGKRVLGHFLAQGCRGIYVTHLKELSEAQPQIVSLRAMLDGKGSPTFKIARGEASDCASAANQVNKYRLTYSQLKERLS